MTTQPKTEVKASERAANDLLVHYMIGTASRFCDDAPDFDSASVEEIAKIIEANTQCDTLASQLTHAQSTIEAMTEQNRELVGALTKVQSIIHRDDIAGYVRDMLICQVLQPINNELFKASKTRKDT